MGRTKWVRLMVTMMMMTCCMRITRSLVDGMKLQRLEIFYVLSKKQLTDLVNILACQ